MQALGMQTTLQPGEDSCFAYVLSGAQTLNTTGFKVMCNLTAEGLVKGYVSALNGRARLVYDTGRFVPLSVAAANLTPAQFLRIAQDLFRLLGVVRDNGFLRLENVLTDEGQILIDDAQRVHLIYLPVDGTGATARLNQSEQAARRSLAQLIERCPGLQSAELVRWREALTSADETMSGVLSALDEAARPLAGEPEPPREAACAPICLTRVGDGAQIGVDAGQSAVIGRNPERSSVILADADVSGEHCRVFASEGAWMVEDLDSMNGTTLNGRRLAPRCPAALRPGDVVQLARHVFIVKMQVR